jgi:hypothetical protein
MHCGSRRRRSSSLFSALSTILQAALPLSSGQGGTSGNFWDGFPSDSSTSSPSSHCSLLCNISIILQVSPKTGSSTFGYIFLDTHKCHHQEPITVYFTSTGCNISSLPCPDFDTFFWANFLRTQDISFVTRLPQCVIPLGHWIIEDDTNSDEVALNQSWLPDLPSTSFHSCSSSPHDNLALLDMHGPHFHSGPHSKHLDPDKINPTARPPLPAVPRLHPPSTFPMGGCTAQSIGALSPLIISKTLNLGGDMASIKQASNAMGGSLAYFSSNASVFSSMMGLVIPALSDSS